MNLWNDLKYSSMFAVLIVSLGFLLFGQGQKTGAPFEATEKPSTTNAPPPGSPATPDTVPDRGPNNECKLKLWQRVYRPSRFKVINACFTVIGTLERGATREADGDLRAWIEPDEFQRNILLPGNRSAEAGNIVIEIVCYNSPRIVGARATCGNYRSELRLPPIGSHVEVSGPLVEDLAHVPVIREIHPVERIELFTGKVPK